MLILTINSDYYSDDFHFKFVWTELYPEADTKACNGLVDILASMKNYYLKSGGRVLCHILAYLFVNLPKFIFNISNSLCFTFLIMVFCKNISLSVNVSKLPALPLAFFLLTYCAPYFGDNCVWISGSANYMWPTVLILCAAISICNYAKRQNSNSLITMLVLCILSAATNETTGGMILIFMFITFVFEHKLSIKKQLLPYIAVIPSMLSVILAPGNAYRREHYMDGDIESDHTVWDVLLYFINSYFEKYYILFSILVFLMIFHIIKIKSLKKAIVDFKHVITGACGIGALVFSGSVPLRPAYIGFVLLLIGFSSLLFIFVNHIVNAVKSRKDLILHLNFSVKLFWISAFVCCLIKNFSDTGATARMRFNTINDTLMISAITVACYIVLRILSKAKFLTQQKPAKAFAVIICVAVITHFGFIINDVCGYLDKCRLYDEYIELAQQRIAQNDVEDILLNSSAKLNIKYGGNVFYPHLSANNICSAFGITWLAMNDNIYIPHESIIVPREKKT